MITPWFDPQWGGIVGGLFGTAGGLWGALAGSLAPLGKAKPLVMGLGIALATAAVLMLIAAAVALATGQPYGVWYVLGLSGLIGSSVLLPLLFVVRVRYRQAEQRRMEAQDFE